jgi:acylglycerol lipase
MKQFNEEPFRFNNHEHIYGATNPEYISSDDGIKLAYYHIKSNDIPKAIMLFIHGAGAHCYMSDYQQISKDLLQNRIDCYFMDIRGHGYSEGPRGTTPSKKHVWMDIKALVAFVKKENYNIPLYLTGHSSGAGTVINYATWKKRLECDGYILISPYLGWRARSYRKTMMEDNFASANISHFVVNIISLGLFGGNKTSVFYNYPQDQLRKDPLIVTSISCNMSNSCTLWNPRKQFKMLKKPIALFIGSDDELFDPVKVTGYKSFISDTIKKQSHIEIIPNMKHLSILTTIDKYITNVIKEFQLTTAST